MSLLDKASLIVTPNAYKESKLYSVVPNTTLGDMDVVRATTATRVNSLGLIEVVPRNLIANSQVLNVAYWTKDLTTVIDNNTTAPNGTTTASKLTEAAGTGSRHIHNASGSFTPIVGASYSMSCFVKLPSTAAGRFVQLPFFIAGFGSNAYVNFDLLNGVVGTIGSSITSSSITLIGDGWYRISASALATATGSSGFQLSFITASSSARTQSYTVTAGSEKAIFLYGLQIEAGAATEYFPTTTRLNIPRIDYTNGSCPSLLIEPPRTNLLTYSEQFDNAAWTKVRALVTANTTISPDGNQNADTFVSAAGQAFFPVLTRTPSFVGNTSYSLSIFAKVLGNTNVFRMGYVDNATGFTGGGASFDLSTQAITITQSPNSSVTANIQNYGNGWYRLNIKFLTIAIPTFNYLEFSISTNDVGNAFALYGGQLEVGAYPTSYIPTVASTITRNADVISKTGISSLIGQTEGTIFVEANLSVNASERRIITVSNGTESQRIIFWTDGTILYANFNNISVTIGTFPIGIAKIALGYTISGGSTTYNIKLNNNTLITGTSATAPNPLNSINIGANTSLGLILNDRINSVQIYKTRLTNAEITSLTTL